MKEIKSCGCIVIHQGKVLIIKQHQGFYGFPKGHMEKNETEFETAKRETKEETGIDVIIIKEKRYEVSYYTRKNNLKKVIYFLAYPKNKLDIHIQEEEILEAKWVPITEVENILTYDNIKELWKKIITNIEI